MNSSIMPAPEHRLCSSTGKRISKVDEVLLLVCARLSTCMVAQGQSPFRQKSSQNRSSRICEVWRNLGKIVSQTKKKPWRILYTQRQIILVLFLERNCSHPLALGYKKKVFLSQGQQHLESGGGDKEALKWKIENIYPKHFTQCSLFFFVVVFLSRLEFVSVFITQIIHTSVKVTRWNKRDQKYSLSKEQNQWHKSTIVHGSLLSWTIPLYCVFIIPLKWVYRVGQVEHSHA